MFEGFNQRAGHYALLLTAGAALFLLNLGGASLWDVDEGRNTTAAYEMLESGDWIKPSFNGVLRTHKPALLYWLQAGAYALFGVNEFAARLPSALAALAALLVIYELGRALFGAATGLLAGLVLGSCVMMTAAARFANPDALLNLFVLLTLTIFWHGYARGGRWWFVPAGAAAGLAVLAKGPTGLLLPGAAIFLFLLWARRLEVLWDRRLGWGLLAFVLVALPWYVWVGVDTKWQFLREFLWDHNVERALTPLENHRGPLYYYLVVLAVGFAPWSVFLGLASWYGLPRSRQRPPADPYRFLWCWIAVYLVPFSLVSTKLPNYVLPLSAPVALLIARFLDRWRRVEVAPPSGLMNACLVCLGLVGGLAGVGLLLAGGSIPLPFLRGRYFPGLEAWAVLGCVPLLGAGAAWWVGRRSRTGLVVTCAVAAVLFLAPLAAWASAALNRHKAPRSLVEQAGALRRDRDIRIGGYQLEHLPSLNFYCQRNVTHLANEQQVRDFLRCPAEDPVYLFLPEPLWEQLRPTVGGGCRVVGRQRDLYRGGVVVVVTNR